ncbi:hypothetical protein [Kineosporia succinea]|uniref:Uncharacterized membrane protein YhaH (DUF805 family) n=1 Tax=Kineosporia succinea TaxID=84632 RepID=A0ABT9NZZ3_9ACTN|nr:hypothetical protein [Kineosporia succinea]MDP9825996.1 uncharacterized membrane protein YhaH (DUF805 family) [Kineosporia succinea]
MQQVRALFEQQDVLATLVVILLVVVIAMMSPRIRDRVSGLGLAFVVLIAVVLAVTVPPPGGWGALADAEPSMKVLSACFTPHTWFTMQGLKYVNVLLFVLPALVLTVMTRRPVLSTLSLSALAAGIEAWQAFSNTRPCTGADWIGGTLGVVIGVIMGITVINRTLEPA